MARDAQVTLAPLDAGTAASLLAGLHELDPRGVYTADDVQRMARGGQCFALQDEGGAQLVYVLNVRNGQVWVNAAKGQGDADLTGLGLAVIERQARGAGLSSVAFQTKRRGLVRKAERCGYSVAGYIMKKELT